MKKNKGVLVNKLRQIISGVLVLTMLLAVLPWGAMPTKAATLSLAQLQEKFPDGKYWNHSSSGRSYNNPDGWTNTPCSCHGRGYCPSDTLGDCRCNYFDGGVQCFGFAFKLAYDAYGTKASGWPSGTLDSLKAGDVIRYKNNGHSIWVTAVNGNTITYADCNSDTYGNTCVIRWNKTISKTTVRATLTWIKSAPYELDGGNVSTHTVDSSYGTNFAAYPKAKITAANIFDANHNQIGSTAWIGTSDKCTIHEVYTDGCCKVTYPLDNGGTKTVYSKISLFRAAVPSVKYWVTSTEYGGEVGEGTAGNSYYLCYYLYDRISKKDWDEVVSSDYEIRLTIYNPDGSVKYTNEGVLDYDRSWIRSFFGEAGTYKVGISASGDFSGSFTKSFTVKENPKEIHSSTNSISLNLSGTKSQTIYLWSSGYYSGNAVWNWSSSNSNISCTWGEWTNDNRLPLTVNANAPGSTTLTILLKDKDSGTVLDSINISVVINVNKTALSVNSTNSAVISTGSEMKFFTYAPTTSGKYVIYSTGSDDTKVYLYNSNWTELDSNDDDGDGNNFRLEYNLTAGNTYTFGVKYYNSSKTGTIPFKFGKVFTITYNANGGSSAPSPQSKDYGTNITLSSTKPTRTGYTFLGWSTNSTATSATYQPGSSFAVDADTTLYAVWEKGCENNTHNYGYRVTKSPTTSATGTLTGTCPKCSGTTTVTLPKLGTTDYSYKVVTAAACTTAGTGRYTWKTTTYGTFTFDVTIPAPGHSYTSKVTAPTCTAQGYTTYTCGCGHSYKDNYVNATGHSYSYKATKAPTTSATGTLTGTCPKCSGTTTVTLPKLGTTDYSYRVVTTATCTTAGTGRYTWKTTTYGTFTFDVTIPAPGHSYTSKVTAPTCTAQGYTTYTCGCGHSYKDNYVNATGHSYSYKATKAPTTSTTGTLTGTCPQCSGTTTVTLPKLGTTDYSYKVVTAAACTTAGTGRYTWKTTTYGMFSFDVTIPATGHTMGDWVQTIAPDCEGEGEKRRDCVNCDFFEIEKVDALGHSLTQYQAKDPTCDEVGWDAFEMCSRCNYTTYQERPAKGHTMGDWFQETSPNCTTEGEMRRDCSVCAFFETCEIEALGHDYVVTVIAPTVDKQGYIEHMCERCGDSYRDNFVDALPVATGDVDGDGQITSTDARLVLQYYAHKIEQNSLNTAAADVDGDGQITSTDARLILQLYAGKITKFPSV